MTKATMIFLVSGKRKSGKDFLSAALISRFGSDSAEIVRISEPIKTHWAQVKKLDLQQLLSDGPYKENYRKQMIEWSDSVRAKDPGYFCREAMRNSTRSIIIVSDIRRKTDIQFFKNENYDIKTVRIEASDEVRKKRGWIFQEGVDDVQSECDLDNYEEWDFKIDNNGGDGLQHIIERLDNLAKEKLS